MGLFKILKEWWYSKDYHIIVCIFGKLHKDSRYHSSCAVYWCYYNDKLKRFRINVSNTSIFGNCPSYPNADFFLPYIYHGDFDSIIHTPDEVNGAQKKANEFLERVNNA
jgi:hypothetical protein